MRFVYCACAVSSMLDDWSGIDQDKATQFILKSQTYDGAFGLAPGQEGHGGSTYVAVASLALMNRLHLLTRKEELVLWCLRNQGDGYHGRPNKPADTCYSFWTGATLKILDAYDMTSPVQNRSFNLSCQTPIGGFGKEPNCMPDIMHSYLGLCGVGFCGNEMDQLAAVEPTLGLTHRALKQSLLPSSSSPSSSSSSANHEDVATDMERLKLQS